MKVKKMHFNTYNCFPNKEIERVIEECERLGCQPKITKLSSLSDKVKDGYTPLGSALESWLYRVGIDPWMLVSDGGDSMPMS